MNSAEQGTQDFEAKLCEFVLFCVTLGNSFAHCQFYQMDISSDHNMHVYYLKENAAPEEYSFL